MRVETPVPSRQISDSDGSRIVGALRSASACIAVVRLYRDRRAQLRLHFRSPVLCRNPTGGTLTRRFRPGAPT